MRSETGLAVAIGFVVVASVVVAVLAPGAVAGPEPEPGHATVIDATVATEEVRADAVTLTVTAHLRHRGGRSENLSVRVRAEHLDSGMHATAEEVSLDPVEGDREVEVPVAVTVPREGGYRLSVLLYQDDRRRAGVDKQVRGVGSLTPPEARTSVEFHAFGGGNETLAPVQATIAEDHGEEVTLTLSTYLTNVGGDDTGDLEVEFVVREADSDLVTDRTRVEVGEIEPSHTATPEATVRVAAGYNYYVDAILWKDGVVVGDATGVANLVPDNPLRVDRENGGAGLQVEGDGDDANDGAPGRTAAPAGEATPGFGIAAALAALAALAAGARFTRRDP